jgi:hypothetical protein
MERRKALQISVLAGLAAQGNLPLLAAINPKTGKGGTSWGGDNRFSEPAAIEPVTGFLPEFTPSDGGSMNQGFFAKYRLVRQYGQKDGAANNFDSGSLEVTIAGDTSRTIETRTKRDGLHNTVKTELQFEGEFNTVKSWTLESTIVDRPEARLVEQGAWDGSTMTVKAKSWTNSYPTGKPLIARYALLPLLASGTLKKAPLQFDLLEDCALRRDQVIRYAGEVEIPVAGGAAVLDSYAHTGWGSVPTHYLVDKVGRVQLITMQTVNWALTEIG